LTLPARSSAIASLAAESGRCSVRIGGALPARTSAISASNSRSVPTSEPRMVWLRIGTSGSESGSSPPYKPTTTSVPPRRRLSRPKRLDCGEPTKSIAAAAPRPVAFITSAAAAAGSRLFTTRATRFDWRAAWSLASSMSATISLALCTAGATSMPLVPTPPAPTRMM
jgi:hypothetical protein